MQKITYQFTPSREEIRTFHQGLRAYNARFVENDFSPFAITVSDEAGRVIAGINGETYWGRLHVDNLWVAENQRKQGIGRQLMGMAEEIARQRGCRGIDLDTMSFQSFRFYEMLGYTKIGEVPGFAGNHKRTYFSKEL